VAADLGRGIGHARLYEQERRLVDELREVDRTKTDFLSTVSHELRTPLTSIAGVADMLRDDNSPLTPEQREMLEVIDRSTMRLRNLIEDLLTLSRIETGEFGTRRQTMDIRAAVAAAVTAVEPSVRRGGLALHTDYPAALMIGADPNQIDRVMVNLLSNAVKFTPAGGQIWVRVATEGDRALISVSDNGIGIPEAEQPALFDRFYRASNATAHAIPGTGLGLTIVRTIVANHDGELTLYSKEGQGTTVVIRLPTDLE
jgi:two-component system, OmpR family, phosphate regulon sensor histidine kinase PhoR